jgi:hypothetical protein
MNYFIFQFSYIFRKAEQAKEVTSTPTSIDKEPIVELKSSASEKDISSADRVKAKIEARRLEKLKADQEAAAKK